MEFNHVLAFAFVAFSLNPYTFLFHLAVFPQFLTISMRTESALASLIVTFLLVTVGWYCVLLWLFNRLKSVLQSPNISRCINAVSGVALIGLGLTFTLTATW